MECIFCEITDYILDNDLVYAIFDKTSGQSVMHVHVHLIPRYTGDTESPNGGVRGVIPEKMKYI